MALKAVVFDLGETLVDETCIWGPWADWLGVPRFTFFGVLGGVIARGEDHGKVFEYIKPGFDRAAERDARRAAGQVETFGIDDFYPDAVPCLRSLKAAGLRLGIVGNQPAWAVPMLHELNLGVDMIGSSESWGVGKPNDGFFTRICQELGLPPAAIAYVGDRIDNDVTPAAAAGMTAVFIRRGPWGYLNAGRVPMPDGTIRIDSLDELPQALGLTRP
jgi:HAD superfamily hydrolase (TIGR01549 family)